MREVAVTGVQTCALPIFFPRRASQERDRLPGQPIRQRVTGEAPERQRQAERQPDEILDDVADDQPGRVRPPELLARDADLVEVRAVELDPPAQRRHTVRFALGQVARAPHHPLLPGERLLGRAGARRLLEPRALEHVEQLEGVVVLDRKSTRLNSSHGYISYAVFCLKKKKNTQTQRRE